MNLLAFDTEIATIVPDGEDDWWQHAPLGISCAALAHREPKSIVFETPHNIPRMSQADARELVQDLRSRVDNGYQIVTWNGLAFDFRLLADESGMLDECAELAMNHIDLMFIVMAYKGHYLGLQKASEGLGLAGKLKNAQLKDGTRITDMSGARAPSLWQQGEIGAVLTYVRQDVLALLLLAERILEHGGIAWISNKGRFNEIPIKKLPTVAECLNVPEPDTKWMSNPPRRADFFSWMKERSPYGN